MKSSVSVILPVFNTEKYIKDSIESIFNQTYPNIELIVVNDCSGDKTPFILERISKTGRNMVLINNRKQMKMSASLNIALKKAKGDYIARQDADDISDPMRISRQVDFLEKNREIGLVGTFFKIIGKSDQIMQHVALPEKDNDIKFLMPYENYICHGSVVFRKEILSTVGYYNEKILAFQDYDYWFRIGQKYGLANIPQYLYSYRKNPSGISSSQTVQDVQKLYDFRTRVWNNRKKIIRNNYISSAEFLFNILNRKNRCISLKKGFGVAKSYINNRYMRY